jgi:hypothetical protein
MSAMDSRGREKVKTSEFIREAMGHVEKGWCKGTTVDDSGNVCMGGALANTMITELDNRVYYAAKFALMNKVRELGWQYITLMNDDPLTTKQDVLNVMEKAALSLEEKGE